MSGNEDGLTVQEVLGNDVLPAWQQSVNDQCQGFGLWQDVWMNVLVSFVAKLGELGVVLDLRRRHVVGSSSFLELLLTVLLQVLGLVISLQGTVSRSISRISRQG